MATLVTYSLLIAGGSDSLQIRAPSVDGGRCQVLAVRRISVIYALRGHCRTLGSIVGEIDAPFDPTRAVCYGVDS